MNNQIKRKTKFWVRAVVAALAVSVSALAIFAAEKDDFLRHVRSRLVKNGIFKSEITRQEVFLSAIQLAPVREEEDGRLSEARDYSEDHAEARSVYDILEQVYRYVNRLSSDVKNSLFRFAMYYRRENL